MGILEEIRKVQEQQKEITKSFFTDVNTPDLVKSLELDIEKGGKRAQLGETREWDGKKYVKTPKGWRPVKKGDQEAKSAEPEIVPSSAHGDFQYNSKDTALEAGKHLQEPHNYSLIQHGGKFVVTTNNRASKFIKQGAKLIGGFLTGGQFHEATTSKTEVASEKGEEEKASMMINDPERIKIQSEVIRGKNGEDKGSIHRINGVEVCRTAKGGDYFSTIKNGTPSTIRNHYKKTYNTDWSHSGLKQVLPQDVFAAIDWKMDFRDSYPDTTWGDQGSAISSSAIKDELQSVFNRARPKKKEATLEENAVKKESEPGENKEKKVLDDFVSFISGIIDSPKADVRFFNSHMGKAVTIVPKNSSQYYSLVVGNDGYVYTDLFNRKFIKTQSLADPSKSYQTTSAYKFKTEKMKLNREFPNFASAKIAMEKYFGKLKEKGFSVI